MDPGLALALLALALIDSLSIGTLLIPLLLLLAPRLRPGRILLYLATIAGFYLLIGVAAMTGVDAIAETAVAVLQSRIGLIAQLVLGVGLVVGSFFIETKKGAEAEDSDAVSAPGRLTRWRDRLLDARTHPGGIMAVALAAGLLEVATMLPYLAAMGMLADSPLPLSGRIVVLAVYCGVMIAPALLLFGLRAVVARHVDPLLRRLAAWLQRTGKETTAWVVGIVGALIALGAAEELGLLALLNVEFTT